MTRRAPICKRCGKHPATGPDRETDLTWRRSICDECHAVYMLSDVLAIARHEVKLAERRRLEQENPG